MTKEEFKYWVSVYLKEPISVFTCFEPVDSVLTIQYNNQRSKVYEFRYYIHTDSFLCEYYSNDMNQNYMNCVNTTKEFETFIRKEKIKRLLSI